MASYSLEVNVLKRSMGRSGIATAAYCSRSKLHDDRLGRSFDYSKKMDLAHSEIITPEGAPAWMKDREKLWNAVEKQEKRKDSQIYRTVRISLPVELTHEQNVALTRTFVKEAFVSRGMVADVNIHKDPNNPHAHILLSMRKIEDDGFARLKATEWNHRSNVPMWRELWADVQNQHLRLAGHDVTVDHRSYKDRGIDIEPQIKMGPSGHNRDSDLTKTEELRRIMRENGDRIIANPYIAIEELSYQRALFSDHDIERFVSSHSDDREQFQATLDAIHNCDALISLGVDADGLNKYTARDLAIAEKQMLETAKNLSEKSKHRVKERYIDQAIATRTMNDDQLVAFRHVTQGGDTAAVIGYAGTGKSYTLGAVREAYEAQGYRLQGMALSGIAAEGLEHGSGIKSSTIHRQMNSWEKGYELPDKKTVVVVDEAGMVGTRQMHKLTEYVKNAGAKLILVGDYDQLQPIEAGGSFRGIVQEIGSATIGEIVRQNSDWQKEATKLLSGSREQVAEALDRYDAKGHIRLSTNVERAKNQLIEDWKDKAIEAGEGEENENIILAFRNVDVQDLNEKARAIWRESGRLEGEDVEVVTAKGRRQFAPGDRVLFLKNDYGLGVKNGSLGTLEAIHKNTFAVRLYGGKTVAFDPRQYQSFDHGYAATVHKSQGVTVSNTFVLATRHMDKHAAYVALTRHEFDVRMYAGIDPDSPRWDTFKDFGHMKMMLSRDGKKELVKDYGVHRGVDVDLGRIYQKGFYEITVNSPSLKKPWTRTQIVSGKLNTVEHRRDLREKAQAFADKTAKITGVDKRTMSIKVEKINDDRFVALNEKWKQERQAKQDARTKSPFLSRTAMAQVNWPPFAPEEQRRLLEKYNDRYVRMIRFAGKQEQVQGEYGGDFDHKGVRVGIIDMGGEGLSRYTMVPFTEELDEFKGKPVRYNLANRKLSGRLHKQLRMTITDTVKKRSHTKEVTIEMGGAKEEAAQRRALARAGVQRFGPNSGQLKVSFEELTFDQKKRRQLEQAGEKRAFKISVAVPGTKRPFEKIEVVDAWERPEAIEKNLDRSARAYVSQLAFKLRSKAEEVKGFKVDVAEIPFEARMEKYLSRGQGLKL